MDRRDFFSSIATGAGLALGTTMIAGSEANANWGMIAPGPVPGPEFDGRLLVNKARAYEVMDREGLDGIVGLNPVNVFYLGNYFGYELQKLRAIPSFVVMPRAEDKPTFLVTSGSDTQFLANGDREYPEIVPYSFPLALDEYVKRGDWSKEPEASLVGNFAMSNEPLQPKEKQWVEFGKRINERRAATPEWGLVRALELAGLGKGKIAVDDMRIAHILSTIGRSSVTCVPGDNTFRKIRIIKSEVELKHMRAIARINQDACMAMLKQVRKGTTKAEIDNMFMVEAAKRGAKLPARNLDNWVVRRDLARHDVLQRNHEPCLFIARGLHLDRALGHVEHQRDGRRDLALLLLHAGQFGPCHPDLLNRGQGPTHRAKRIRH